MRTIKLFVVIGLAVALVGTWAMAQTQTPFPAPANANDIEIVSEQCVITDAFWTQDGKQIGSIAQLKGRQFNSLDIGFRDRFGVFRINGQPVTGISVPPNANDIEIVLEDCVVTLYWTRDGQRIGDPILKGARIKVIHVDNKAFKVLVTTVPTLTEWGLIALAVLLAGGMGYMIYRRRPALRPAAP